MGCVAYQPSNLYKCKIGNYCRIGPFVEIQEDVEIGASTVVSSHCFICAGSKIGSRVFIGHGVMFCNDKHPKANNRDWKYDPPTVDDDVSIGTGAIILPGVRIGNFAVIGAGAVVTRDVPPGVTAVGIWKGGDGQIDLEEAIAQTYG